METSNTWSHRCIFHLTNQRNLRSPHIIARYSITTHTAQGLHLRALMGEEHVGFKLSAEIHSSTFDFLSVSFAVRLFAQSISHCLSSRLPRWFCRQQAQIPLKHWVCVTRLYTDWSDHDRFNISYFVVFPELNCGSRFKQLWVSFW